MSPPSQSPVLLCHNVLGQGRKPMPSPSGPGGSDTPQSSRPTAVVTVQETEWDKANLSPPTFRGTNPPEAVQHHSQEKMMNPRQCNNAMHRLLTNNIAPFFSLSFLPSVRSPPSNPHTHPPTQFSLLAWCPTRCHLKVRESSKVGASLLYLGEYLPF